MKEIDSLFKEYVALISYSIEFVRMNFGFENVLLRKNMGEIEASNFQIKNSAIKGFVFHGNGCTFIFKKRRVDVEFTIDNVIGFTEWDFYIFCNRQDYEISEIIIRDYIHEKELEGVLFRTNDVLILI